MVHRPPDDSPRLTTGGRPDGVDGSGVIDVDTSSGSAVDVPPMGKAGDVREVVQYRQRG